ncbi:hypothetical protein O181_063882 [Austropuccinia psidii MF-1]|uniref:SH3 domain-containing protein n=1 Tax=Austropuccinia psidii MF-1 TaxID=1389203 RepID=A0A9Q3EQF8_9BASI|nr:hypothetical protein [Austropuccinia psidii MF-1]
MAAKLTKFHKSSPAVPRSQIALTAHTNLLTDSNSAEADFPPQKINTYLQLGPRRQKKPLLAPQKQRRQNTIDASSNQASSDDTLSGASKITTDRQRTYQWPTPITNSTLNTALSTGSFDPNHTSAVVNATQPASAPYTRMPTTYTSTNSTEKEPVQHPPKATAHIPFLGERLPLEIVVAVPIVFLSGVFLLVAYRIFKRRKSKKAVSKRRRSQYQTKGVSNNTTKSQDNLDLSVVPHKFEPQHFQPFQNECKLDAFVVEPQNNILLPDAATLASSPKPQAVLIQRSLPQPEAAFVHLENAHQKVLPGGLRESLLSESGGTPCQKTCVVVKTFKPQMADELLVGIGDQVTVYFLFDDGWCFGHNLNIQKHYIEGEPEFSRSGVLPQACLLGLRDDLSQKLDETLLTESLAGITETSIGEAQGEELVQESKKRSSSLLCDREAKLFLELERALNF